MPCEYKIVVFYNGNRQTGLIKCLFDPRSQLKTLLLFGKKWEKIVQIPWQIFTDYLTIDFFKTPH